MSQLQRPHGWLASTAARLRRVPPRDDARVGLAVSRWRI